MQKMNAEEREELLQSRDEKRRVDSIRSVLSIREANEVTVEDEENEEENEAIPNSLD